MAGLQTLSNEGLEAFCKSTVPRLGRVHLDVTAMSLIYVEVVKLLSKVEDRRLQTILQRPLLAIPVRSC